jgi:hypothetical protein
VKLSPDPIGHPNVLRRDGHPDLIDDTSQQHAHCIPALLTANTSPTLPSQPAVSTVTQLRRSNAPTTVSRLPSNDSCERLACLLRLRRPPIAPASLRAHRRFRLSLLLAPRRVHAANRVAARRRRVTRRLQTRPPSRPSSSVTWSPANYCAGRQRTRAVPQPCHPLQSRCMGP